jgi:hypothetical protein
LKAILEINQGSIPMTRIRKTVPSAVALCFICFLGTVPWAALAQTPEDIEVAARIRDTIRNTRQRLADAKTDDDKQAARAQLRQLLADVFVQDMRMREKHAAEIEARLAKLRQQYREREKVKDAIIDLQLKVIEHDAAGLDFPGGLSFTPSPGRKVPPSPNEPRNRGDIRNRGDAPRIRDELPLDQFKEVHADAIEAMTALGHFVESPDGRFFVYANSNRPRGPSEIRLIDSATGRPVATTTVSFAVAALEFTDSGVV